MLNEAMSMVTTEDIQTELEQSHEASASVTGCDFVHFVKQNFIAINVIKINNLALNFILHVGTNSSNVSLKAITPIDSPDYDSFPISPEAITDRIESDEEKYEGPNDDRENIEDTIIYNDELFNVDELNSGKIFIRCQQIPV